MFFDLSVFVESGRALWAGEYIGLYPLPMVGVFALMALVPFPVLAMTMLATSLVLFVAVMKRDALLWTLYMPVLWTLYLGQLDLIALWLLRHESAVSLALLTLKPQLGVLAIPALIRRAELRKPFALACAALYLPVTAVRPMWILEWLRRFNDGRMDVGITAITEVAPLAFVVLIVLAATRCVTVKRMFWAFNPTLRWYDLALLAGGSRWLVPLSWAAFGVAKLVGDLPWPVALLGLV